MTNKEKQELAAALIEEGKRIGEKFRQYIPSGSHLSMCVWPDGHIDVCIGNEDFIVINAFVCANEDTIHIR